MKERSCFLKILFKNFTKAIRKIVEKDIRLDLAKKEIVFTRQLTDMTRNQAIELARFCGAYPQFYLTPKADYVVSNGTGNFFPDVTAPTYVESETYYTEGVTEEQFLEWCSTILQVPVTSLPKFVVEKFPDRPKSAEIGQSRRKSAKVGQS